jgi:DNA repair exonuclease SbcCD ATPase subunit
MGESQALTQVKFDEQDFTKAEAIARALGYEQFPYTSTSSLWGLFCLPENPRTWRGARQALQGGCIIKTRELGFLFVQDGEDRHLGNEGRGDIVTYRERREARAERLREWAEKRERDAGAILQSHERYRGDHAFNFQPGHIPERARVIAQADRAFESLGKAGEMASKAANIEAATDNAIYSDDVDAVERLEARIAELEQERDRWKAYNRSCKKGAPDLTVLDDAQRANVATIQRVCAYQLGKHGEITYTNLSANITRNRKRLEELRRRAVMVEAGDRGHGRPMLSRYAGVCSVCDGPIERGAEIVYYRMTREALHAGCVES